MRTERFGKKLFRIRRNRAEIRVRKLGFCGVGGGNNAGGCRGRLMADPPQRRPKSDEEEGQHQDNRIQQEERISGRVVVTGPGFKSCDWKKKKWGREAC